MSQQGRNILLFEDEGGVALLTKDFLEKAGHHVTVSTNGKVGLDLLRRNTYDVVLVDQDLPDMSGLELFERIRTRRPDQICIMVTGSGDEEIAVKAIQSGFYDYIVKALNMAHLSVLPYVIEKSIERSHVGQEKNNLRTELEGKNKNLNEVNNKLKLQLQELAELKKTKMGADQDLLQLKREVNQHLKELGKPEKYKLKIKRTSI